MTDTKLSCIITGMENSGTTFLSQNIASHSLIKGGFECGILLGNINNFEKVLPFSKWLKNADYQYGLPNNYLDEIKNMNYKEIYDYICINKGNQGTSHDQLILKGASFIYDKTPRYVYHLQEILRKIKDSNLNIPVFIICKNFDLLYYSRVIKRNGCVNNYLSYIKLFIKQMKYLKENKKENVFLFDFENYIKNIDKYNNFIMNIINKYNKNILIEKLDFENFKTLYKNMFPYCNYNNQEKDNIIKMNNYLVNPTDIQVKKINKHGLFGLKKDFIQNKEIYNNLIKELEIVL